MNKDFLKIINDKLHLTFYNDVVSLFIYIRKNVLNFTHLHFANVLKIKYDTYLSIIYRRREYMQDVEVKAIENLYNYLVYKKIIV